MCTDAALLAVAYSEICLLAPPGSFWEPGGARRVAATHRHWLAWSIASQEDHGDPASVTLSYLISCPFLFPFPIPPSSSSSSFSFSSPFSFLPSPPPSEMACSRRPTARRSQPGSKMEQEESGRARKSHGPHEPGPGASGGLRGTHENQAPVAVGSGLEPHPYPFISLFLCLFLDSCILQTPDLSLLRSEVFASSGCGGCSGDGGSG